MIDLIVLKFVLVDIFIVLDDINSIVMYFKNKKKFRINKKEDLNKILLSEKYEELINILYKYYNLKKQPNTELRLSPQCYRDVNKKINYFWKQLLGTKWCNEFYLISE